MSKIGELIFNGDVCEICGVWLEEESHGHPRHCSNECRKGGYIMQDLKQTQYEAEDAVYNMYHYGNYDRRDNWNTFISGKHPSECDWLLMTESQRKEWAQAKCAWNDNLLFITNFIYELESGDLFMKHLMGEARP